MHMTTGSINQETGSPRCFLTGPGGHREPVQCEKGRSHFSFGNVFPSFLSAVTKFGCSHNLPVPQVLQDAWMCQLSEGGLEANPPPGSRSADFCRPKHAAKDVPGGKCRNTTARARSRMDDYPDFRTLRSTPHHVVHQKASPSP